MAVSTSVGRPRTTALAVTATDTGTAGLGSMVAARAIPGTMRGIHGGFIGGMQVGFNWQFAPTWVAGIETDFDWLANSVAMSVFPYAGVGGVPGAQHHFREGARYARHRARAVRLADRRPSSSSTRPAASPTAKRESGPRSFCPSCAPPAAISSTSSGIATGWTVGAGLEWQFAPGWSVKGEYLWVDLGSRSETISYPYAAFNSTLTSSVHQRDGIVRTGLTYRFW